MRPTYAEIRLQSLVDNYQRLEASVYRWTAPAPHHAEARVRPVDGARAVAGERPSLIAVIKANAYGHGLRLCGRALAEAGAGWLGVTSVEEAVLLRGSLGRPRVAMPGAAPAEPRVVVMSGFFPGEEGEVFEHRLTPLVWEGYHLALLDAAARRREMPPGTVPVHLEIDTGMSRQGVTPGATLRALLRGAGLEHDSPLAIEGVLTHFSSPDDKEITARQVAGLREALGQLREAGIGPRWVHAGNSTNAVAGVQLLELADVARKAGAQLLVRPGLALYGVSPTGILTGEMPLERVLSWKTQVTSLRVVPPGTPVGYNETFRAEAPGGTRLALLPVGYADGLNRLLSNRGAVLIRGRRAPIVGRVSMDQTVVDVSGNPECQIGDEVVLLGSQGAEMVTAAEIAGVCGTIPYEVLCGIAARVRRVAV